MRPYDRRSAADPALPGVLFVAIERGSDVIVGRGRGRGARSPANPRSGEGRVGIRTLYYGVLAAFSVWAIVALRLATPFQLFKLLANMAGVVLAIAGVQVFLVNRRFLPRALRPSAWREGALLLCSAFYAFFAWFAVRDLLRGLLG
jgi:predicted anti-sigma-YlaC factor YlaD